MKVKVLRIVKLLCKILHHFRPNFEKMVQKILISRNCLQFPEIPAKIREILTEKSAISADFQQNFEKISKDHQNLRKSQNFKIGAVQKSGNPVELEKC